MERLVYEDFFLLVKDFFIHMPFAYIIPCRIIFLNSKLSQGFSTLWYVLCFCACPFFNTECFFKFSRLEMGRWVSFDGYFQVMASKRYKLIRYRNMTGRVWVWILKFHLWWMNFLEYLHCLLCKRTAQLFYIGPPQVKCRLLISSIFYLMIFRHFSKRP